MNRARGAGARLHSLAVAATLAPFAVPSTQPMPEIRPQLAPTWCWAAASQTLAEFADTSVANFDQAWVVFRKTNKWCPGKGNGTFCKDALFFDECNTLGTAPALDFSYFASAGGTDAFTSSWSQWSLPFGPAKKLLDACTPFAFALGDGSSGHWLIAARATIDSAGDEWLLTLNPAPCCRGQRGIWIPFSSYEKDGVGGLHHDGTTHSVEAVDSNRRRSDSPTDCQLVPDEKERGEVGAIRSADGPARSFAENVGKRFFGAVVAGRELRRYTLGAAGLRDLAAAGGDQPYEQLALSRALAVTLVFPMLREDSLVGAIVLRPVGTAWEVDSVEEQEAAQETFAWQDFSGQAEWFQVIAPETGLRVTAAAAAAPTGPKNCSTAHPIPQDCLALTAGDCSLGRISTAAPAAFREAALLTPVPP